MLNSFAKTVKSLSPVVHPIDLIGLNRDDIDPVHFAELSLLVLLRRRTRRAKAGTQAVGTTCALSVEPAWDPQM